MTDPERNDPCPCGSGFKYKKCCLLKAPCNPNFSTEDRESALRKLEAFACDPALSEVRAAATGRFMGPRKDAVRGQEDPLLEILSREANDFWFFFGLLSISRDGQDFRG